MCWCITTNTMWYLNALSQVCDNKDNGFWTKKAEVSVNKRWMVLIRLFIIILYFIPLVKEGISLCTWKRWSHYAHVGDDLVMYMEMISLCTCRRWSRYVRGGDDPVICVEKMISLFVWGRWSRYAHRGDDLIIYVEMISICAWRKWSRYVHQGDSNARFCMQKMMRLIKVMYCLTNNWWGEDRAIPAKTLYSAAISKILNLRVVNELNRSHSNNMSTEFVCNSAGPASGVANSIAYPAILHVYAYEEGIIWTCVYEGGQNSR